MIDYKDKEGKPIDFLEWGSLFQDKSYQIIKQNEVGEYFVSTVWLGIRHFGGTYFETMVFDSSGESINCCRAKTLKEAMNNHEEMLLRLPFAGEK